MKNLPSGWTTEFVQMLGPRQRVGDEFFRIGYHAQMRGVRLPKSDQWGVIVSNPLRDLRVYGGWPEQPAQLPMHGFPPGSDVPGSFSVSNTGLPGTFQYSAVLPRADEETWDFLVVNTMGGKLHYFPKRHPDEKLEFIAIGPIMDMEGVPDCIDWKRDGQFDLLIAREDGSIVRYPRDVSSQQVAFHDEPELVIDGSVPVDRKGPFHPCVIDLYGKGRSDLLVGDGGGHVMLYRDVGDDDQVAYDRGRRLVDRDGFIEVKGSASPAIIGERGNRFLLVADGDGIVWAWPMEECPSCVTSDPAAAFGGDQSGIREEYHEGSWWLASDEEGEVIVAGPEPAVRLADDEVHTPAKYGPPAPELKLEPQAEGTHEIHIVLRRPEGATLEPVIEMRLSDETAWTMLSGNEFHNNARQQIFWKTADLTGRSIHIRQVIRLVRDPKDGSMCPESGQPTYLESVRLVPVDEAPAGETRKPQVPVAAILDTVMWFGFVKMIEPDEVRDCMAKHHQAGFTRMYYKLGGGLWEYPSRVPGTEFYLPENPTEEERLRWNSSTTYYQISNRVVPAAESCHEFGMECFGWMRVQNQSEGGARPAAGTYDRFFAENPQFLEKDIFGEVYPRKHCLGYKEVRDYHVAICEEAIDMGCDGILMETLRHLPKVMYGDPVVEEFQRRYGLDMRSLPPFDTRVMEVQTEVFTQFLREVKEAIVRKRSDARLHVRVCAVEPLLGCDPGAWVREGIVDEIIIEHRAVKPMEPDIEGLVDLCKGSQCRAGAVFARTFWGGDKVVSLPGTVIWEGGEMTLHPDRVERQVEKYLSAGADSIPFYESARIVDRPEFCRAIRRINHPQYLPSRVV